MSKKAKIIIGIAAGIPTLWAIAFGVAWNVSPLFQETVLEAMLLTDKFPLDNYAAKKLRNYPSENAAISLLTYVNMIDISSSKLKEDSGHRALASLCLLTGQDFGTGFEGTVYNFSWGPPTGERWDEVIGAANEWAMGAFGPEVLLIIAATSATEDDDEDEEEAENVESEAATAEVKP